MFLSLEDLPTSNRGEAQKTLTDSKFISPISVDDDDVIRRIKGDEHVTDENLFSKQENFGT